MKRLNALVLFSAALFACVEPAAEPPQEGETAQAVKLSEEQLRKLPPAAAKAMKDAESINLTPIFYACPYWLSYTPFGMTSVGDTTPEWVPVVLGLFVVDKPSVVTLGGNKYAVCGTTQSAETFMYLRRQLPAGYSACTMSSLGQDNAWFVCT